MRFMRDIDKDITKPEGRSYLNVASKSSGRGYQIDTHYAIAQFKYFIRY
jgi:hypothetical protein